MSAPGPGSPTPRASASRRWLMPLLVASLAFNLVVIGAAVAERIWPNPDERIGIHRSSVHLLPRQFFVGLDEERRAELTAIFRDKGSEFREAHRALKDSATALADALEREPFDPTSARSAIAEHATRSHRLVDIGVSVTEDLIATLTAEERQALAGAIRLRLEERSERRSRR